MKIYIDVIIIENLIINTFILYMTIKLAGWKCKFKRIFLAGFAGGLYALVMIVPALNILSFLPVQIAVVFIMGKIACGTIKFIDLLKFSIIFFIVSFSLSGICLFLSLRREIYVLGTEYKISSYSIKYSILAMMLLSIVIFRIYDYIKEKAFTTNYIFDVEINFNEQKICFKGFLDTGNSIKEPVTNLPCIIVEKDMFKEINIYNFNVYNIPYNTVSSNGFLKGIRVNKVRIKSKGTLYKEIDAVICICNKKFSAENDFNALLPRGIV